MKDKTVIVTGAFGALGRVVAQALATQGARVALVDLAESAPADLIEKLAGHQILAGVDLTNLVATQEAVSKVAKHFDGVDALVNIAGGFSWETVESGDVDTWESMFTKNLKTALTACKAALPHLLACASAKGGARIVNVGANAAGRAAKGMGAYAASKSSVLRLTEALSDETRDRGLTVNAILPGMIDTPANRKEMPQAEHARWVSPEALADVVTFLLSDAARAITGVGIPVTGRL